MPMKTIEGYSKEKYTDTSVLLAGGGAKTLSDFIGTLTWDSTNKKITYKKVGDTNATDLVTLSWSNLSDTAHKHALSDINSGFGAAYRIIYSTSATATSTLAANTSTTKKFLRMTGTGSAGAAPAWDTVSKSDVGLGNVENTALSTWAGSTNITKLGTVATGTWSATTIAVNKGGTGKTSWTKYGIVYASDTTTLAQISVPTWAASTTYFLKAVTNSSKVPTYSLATIGKADVGLGNVDNTADANKSVSYAATAGNADTVDQKHADFLSLTQYLYHDVLAFGNHLYEWYTSSNGTSFTKVTAGTDALKPMFDGKGDVYDVASYKAIRIVFNDMAWTNAQYLIFQGSYSSAWGTETYNVEFSSDGSNWTAGASGTLSCSASYQIVEVGYTNEAYMRITFKQTGSGTSVPISNIRYITSRLGNQGGEPIMPYTWDEMGRAYVYYAENAGSTSVSWDDVTGKPNRAGSDSDGGPANTVKGAYTSSGGKQNPNYFGVNNVGFLMMNTTVNNNTQYKDWIIMDCYSGDDVGGGVALGVNRQSLGAYIMRSAAARTSWAESAELLGTHNYTTYCASKTHSHSAYVQKAGDTMSGTLTFTSTTPMHFYGNGEGTYTRAVMYADSSGLTFETPRATEAANGVVLPFMIKTRGGQYGPLEAGSGTFTDTLVLKAGAYAADATYTYPGGSYAAVLRPNMRLIGDSSKGISTIEFISQKGDTNINKPSDCAFIQFQPYGTTTQSAVGSQPTLASSGEANRLVIGVNNDANDYIVLQTPDASGLKHAVATNLYTIWTSGNDGASSGLDADLLDGKHYSDISSDFVTLTTDQSISGIKTFNDGKWALYGAESCEITNKSWADATYYKNDDSALMFDTTAVSIRTALRFRWYNSYWDIGNVRSSNANTMGFGIGVENSAGTHIKNCFFVTTDGKCYAGEKKLQDNVFIDTHGEGAGTLILGLENDLYAFFDRGGTCTAYEVAASTTSFTAVNLTHTSTTVAALDANVFSGRISYNQGTVYSGSAFAVYDLTLPQTFTYDTKFFWSFGSGSWVPTKIRILTAKNSGTYTLKYTSDSCPVYDCVALKDIGGTGFNKLRIVVSKYQRLCTFGIKNYAGIGAGNTYMSNCIDNFTYRSITPGKNNTYLLGSSNYKWNAVYATNFYGTISYATSAGTAASADVADCLSYSSVTDLTTAKEDLKVKWFAPITKTSTNPAYAGSNAGFPASNNANGILWLGTHSGNYGAQLGISSNGHVYYRFISAGSFPTTANGGSWQELLTNASAIVYYDDYSTNPNLDTFTNQPYLATVGTTGNTPPGTIPNPPSSNAVAVLNAHTHTGNYYSQLLIDTNNNKLWVRSAHNVTSFGNWEAIPTLKGIDTNNSYATNQATYVYDSTGNIRGSGNLLFNQSYANLTDSTSALLFEGNSNNSGTFLMWKQRADGPIHSLLNNICAFWTIFSTAGSTATFGATGYTYVENFKLNSISWDSNLGVLTLEIYVPNKAPYYDTTYVYESTDQVTGFPYQYQVLAMASGPRTSYWQHPEHVGWLVNEYSRSLAYVNSTYRKLTLKLAVRQYSIDNKYTTDNYIRSTKMCAVSVLIGIANGTTSSTYSVGQTYTSCAF